MSSQIDELKKFKYYPWFLSFLIDELYKVDVNYVLL
jgi:hypothetical protein